MRVVGSATTTRWVVSWVVGGLTLTALVAQPGLVDAAVIKASVSSLAADNWRGHV